MVQFNMKENIPLTADCNECPHKKELYIEGRCKPDDICVRAMGGKQIEYFFRQNPAKAEDYTADEYWVRRTIAIRCLAQQHLLELINAPGDVSIRSRRRFFKVK